MKYAWIVLLLALSGCIPVSPEKLAAASDRELCKMAEPTINHSDKTVAQISAEVRRRQLDCSVGHAACTSYGFMRGTPEYANCRMTVDQNQQANDAAVRAAVAPTFFLPRRPCPALTVCQ